MSKTGSRSEHCYRLHEGNMKRNYANRNREHTGNANNNDTTLMIGQKKEKVVGVHAGDVMCECVRSCKKNTAKHGE